MNKKNGPSLGHNKKTLLKSEVEHIDITSFDSKKNNRLYEKNVFHFKGYC